MSDDELDEIAAQLYALTPEEFTPARNEAVEAAKAAGDRTLAAAVAKLRKPNAVAWVANQLARAQPAEIAALRSLGDELREATATLDRQRLRELSARQRPAVAALVRQAGVLADGAGQPMSKATSRSLEDTLHAAMADAGAGAALAAGRLTTALASTGFPGLDSEEEAPAPEAPPRRAPAAASTGQESDDDRLATARGQAEEARRRAASASDDADRADEVARRAGGSVDQARARVAAVRRELEAATRDLDVAEEVLRSAKADALTAKRTADRAQRALEATEEHLRRLGGRRR